MRRRRKVKRTDFLPFSLALFIILFSPFRVEEKPVTVSFVLSRMSQAEKKLASFAATFEEERSYAYDPLREHLSGKIYYMKPAKIRWEYLAPAKKEIVITPKKAWIYLPAAKQVQVIKFSGKAKFSSLPIGFGGPSPTVSQDYELKLLPEKNGLIPLELIPKPETEAASYYRKIVIYLNRQRWLPASRIEFFELNGDATSFTLSDISLNPKIPEKIFSFSFPEGVEIIDYSR
jgi:outer membrane lipoprotein carrier protein